MLFLVCLVLLMFLLIHDALLHRMTSRGPFSKSRLHVEGQRDPTDRLTSSLDALTDFAATAQAAQGGLGVDAIVAAPPPSDSKTAVLLDILHGGSGKSLDERVVEALHYIIDDAPGESVRLRSMMSSMCKVGVVGHTFDLIQDQQMYHATPRWAHGPDGPHGPMAHGCTSHANLIHVTIHAHLTR